MFLYKRFDEYFIFIHIPKNGGKYIRNKIKKDKKNILLKEYWNVRNNFDLAHIPYSKKEEFIPSHIKYQYYTFTRNPYERYISAFFYVNEKKFKSKPFLNTIYNKENIELMKKFLKETIHSYFFSSKYPSNMIHFFPQYMFLIDKEGNIPKNINIKKLEDYFSPKRYDINKMLDKECIQIINKVYEKDFSYFDYEKM